MSICAQAKARRRKARQDKRYRRPDAAASAKRLAAKLAKEKAIKQRSSKKGS